MSALRRLRKTSDQRLASSSHWLGRKNQQAHAVGFQWHKMLMLSCVLVQASLKATTLCTKQRLGINSTHERATFAATACIILTGLGEQLSCLNASADGTHRTLTDGCTSKLWGQSTLPYLRNRRANNVTRVSMPTSVATIIAIYDINSRYDTKQGSSCRILA